ncbi:thioesterase-like superfamily-domain-containing protein [Favolaschia claudopus]|uniref:Thioesterase-like superfamily-domain-containing protein n=1 Tax=Favolaschia claudopus TaxID=2862362 RepID=A0AAW0DAY2_9AGAR
MAPLGKALNAISCDADDATKTGNTVFSGDIDSDWRIGNVPNGGYVLSLILESCIRYQVATSHRDLIHVSAHFLQATSIASFEVHVRTLKIGRGFTNVTADLIQQSRTRITTHLIFGTLDPPRLLLPPSTYARRLPLYLHPSIAEPSTTVGVWKFSQHMKWSIDPHLRAQNGHDSPTRTSPTTVGGGGVVWGAWLTLTDPAERITPASIAFLADTFVNMPFLVPKEERGGVSVGDSWYPTMTLSIEFKAPIPPPSERHAARTVGLYCKQTFWGEPQGRHDPYVEVWTAPAELGETGKVKDGWREEQICLATATQMALVIPMEVNKGRAKYDAPAKGKL